MIIVQTLLAKKGVYALVKSSLVFSIQFSFASVAAKFMNSGVVVAVNFGIAIAI